MNLFVKFVFILLKCSLLWAALTISNEESKAPENRIMGGINAKPHAHPYIVSLQIRFLFLKLHICAGTLLNEYWILSAAHCIPSFFLIKWLPMEAIAGSNNINHLARTAQIATISKRIPHPLFTSDIAPYDIAMLKTSKPFTFTKEVKPINLPENSQLRHKDLILAGWGELSETSIIFSNSPSKLQEVRVQYIPYKECHEAMENLFEDDGSIEDIETLKENVHICTGPLTGGVAACSGDSGGPLIEYISHYNNDNAKKEFNYGNDVNSKENSRRSQDGNADHKTPYIIGIVSWGFVPCGEPGAPTVFTNVSHYIDFIYDHIYE